MKTSFLSRQKVPYDQASACLSASYLIKLLVARSTPVITSYSITVLCFCHFQPLLYVRNIFPPNQRNLTSDPCLLGKFLPVIPGSLTSSTGPFHILPTRLRAPVCSHSTKSHFTANVSLHIWLILSQLNFIFLICNFSSADISPGT